MHTTYCEASQLLSPINQISHRAHFIYRANDRTKLRTSIGLTVILRAESSHAISTSAWSSSLVCLLEQNKQNIFKKHTLTTDSHFYFAIFRNSRNLYEIVFDSVHDLTRFFSRQKNLVKWRPAWSSFQFNTCYVLLSIGRCPGQGMRSSGLHIPPRS